MAKDHLGMKSLHFLYHELRPEKTAYSYVVAEGLFRDHCALFARLRESGNGMLRPEVTFDDGNRSDLQHAAPVLEQFGLRATFFITAAWTGTRRGFLNAAELQELHRRGHRIGAHGLHHKLLTQCTAAELQSELTDSRQRLEDILGQQVTTMSLPGGRANRRVLRACDEAGYTQIFTSVPEGADLVTNPRQVGRLNLQGDTTVEWLQRVLDPSSGLLARLHRADQIKGAAKRVLGDRLYARLWAAVNRAEASSTSVEEPAL